MPDPRTGESSLTPIALPCRVRRPPPAPLENQCRSHAGNDRLWMTGRSSTSAADLGRNTRKGTTMEPRAANAMLLTAVLLNTGCLQRQATTSDQMSEQATAGVTSAWQESLADGPRAAVFGVTNPHGLGRYTSDGWEDETPEPQSGDDCAEVKVTFSAPPGTANTVTFGNVTITQAGVEGTGAQSQAGGSTSSGQTPSNAANGGSMVQEPRSSAAVPITVSAAPGSTAQGGPTSAIEGEGATGGAQTSTQEASSLQQQLKAARDQISSLTAALQSALTAQTDPSPENATAEAGENGS